jgi:YD repeat-containing protein
MSFLKLPRAFALAFVFIASAPAFSEEIRDYYAEPGINPFKETINDSFHEQVDPFSGTMQLKYTDLHVPGNGGMDITISRTYTSLQTNAYPKLNQNGLGWTMHFGRIVVSQNHLSKLCVQGTFPLTTKENPSLELPDGGREILALSSIHNDGTLITRSNWIARCIGGQGMVVTAPNGTRYTMDRFDNFQEEPSFLTSRIEDVHGNWIAIDYAQNALSINYITQIRRREDGVVVVFEYEDLNTPGIAVSAITAGTQRVSYEYETIPGFMFGSYKQLVSATRPDGRSWTYAYNPRMPDPDPNDEVAEDGIASYSLVGVTYPYGAHIAYTYQYVAFDPGAPFERTTAIHTKVVSGGDVTGGTWTYEFAPHSEPYPDNQGGDLRYDVTTVTAPEARYVYKHYGKDFRAGGLGTMVFVRPSFVGLLVIKETYQPGGNLLERVANSWGQRKISDEDFWHGGGYREWWRDDGTYAAVLAGEYVSRDNAISGSVYAHARLSYDFDAFGNPGRVYSHSNVSGQPGHQVLYTYHNDISRWIVGIPEDETHQKIAGAIETALGSIERNIDSNGNVTELVEFGEETRYTYTGAGDLETVRDARGKVTTFSNYKRGIAQDEHRPESVHISRVVNDSGTLRSESDGRGNITRYTYDDLHRLTSIDYPIKADVGIAYEDGTGSYRRVLTRGNYRQTDTINDFGETRRVERRDTTTNQAIVRTSEFDAFGRETFTSYPNDTIGNTTTYDALGRILRIQHPDSAFVRYEYDDAVATVTNERSHSTQYLYAMLGTAYSQDDPVVIREPEKVTTNIYRDVWGNVIELFQGEELPDNSVLGYGKTYRYNARRLLVESNEPEVGTTVFDHDEVGNVISERINNLPIVTFAYDGLNRRTSVNFSDATPDIATEYDDSGNIERVTKGTTEWVYTYDENSNLRSERLTINHALLSPRVYLISRAYSDLDVLSTLTYPSGLAIDYAPDGFGRATRVGSFASNIGYHPSGSIASYQLANGVTTNIAINQRLLTQSITAPGVVQLSYGYDAAGNVLNISDGIDSSKNVSMHGGSYDGLGRLRHAQGRWGNAYFTYDFHGNFKTKEVGQKGMAYGLDGNQRARTVSQYSPSWPSNVTGTIRLDYDQRGNTTARRNLTNASLSTATLDERLFVYDSASHLIRARVSRTTPTGTTAIAAKDYAYDGNGQRVLEQQHGSYDIRFSVHGKDGQLMFEDVLAGCTRTDHVRLGATAIAKSDDLLASPTLDTDGDQITDCYESLLGLDANSAADASADSDGDGLTNLQEFRTGTSLSRADTDGDGLSDRDEVERDLTDPSVADTDGDGLTDAVEAANPQLDPRSPDKDHDGVTDYWETRLQTNPAVPDGLLDTDADGFSNRQESSARSDPELAATRPARGAQLWSADTLSAINGSVSIGRDRTIYVASADGRVTAFHPDSTRRWTFAVPESTVMEPTVGPDGSIYLVVRLNSAPQGAPRSFVYAIKADGTQRWVRPTTDRLHSPATVGVNGRVYVGGSRFTSGNSDGIVMGIDSSGEIAALLVIPGNYNAQKAPAVAPSGDVYVATSNVMRAFTAALEPRWTYNLRGNVTASPSVAYDGSVYVGDSAGYVYALSGTGALRWEQQFSGSSSQNSSVAIGANGTLYIGGYASTLFAVNAADGTQRWSAPTTGTVFTPAIAANGNVYATTYAGDLMAFDASGAQIWSFASGSRVTGSPIVDRDGSIYFGTQLGQVYAVADDAGGPARTPWPMQRHDSAASGYVCFNELEFSVVVDGDGDRIDDCAEMRYGMDPDNPADGAADSDGDGLREWEEHEGGTRRDLADTDADGLSDGLEVLTHHTNPLAIDTDHDAVSDGDEVGANTNPLDPIDAGMDADSDGYSNRQESWANTDPMDATSRPAEGQVVHAQAGGALRPVEAAVGRDGTIYRQAVSGLEALYPDFTVKWMYPGTLIAPPSLGADGTIYVITGHGNYHQLVALWPNGNVRWSYRSEAPTSFTGLHDSPAVGPDGTLYFVEGVPGIGHVLRALDRNGMALPNWNPSAAVEATYPRLAVNAAGVVIAYDPRGGLVALRGDTGQRLWRVTSSSILGGTEYTQPVFDADGTIYVLNLGRLTAVNPTNGGSLWVRTGIFGSPLVDSNGHIIVFCAAQMGLCAYDSSGAQVWADSNPDDYSYTGTPTIDANGSILVMTQNNRFIAFNGDGSTRWTAPMPNGAYGGYPIVLDDGTIYATAFGLHALIVGGGHGLADAPWPARERDHKNSRSVSGIADMDPSTAPSVRITAPANNVSVLVGTPVSLNGTASDAEDGTLSQSIVWSSSRDGVLGTGAALTAGPLSVGAHDITARVTDSQSAIGMATVNLIVTEPFNDPPMLNVSAPAEGATSNVGATVNFTGTASDAEDGTITNGITWTSSRDGALGTGAALAVSSLSVGAHTITARIQDSGGKFTTATRNITVVVPSNTQPTISLSAPLNGTAFGAGQTVTLSAIAADTEDGNLTSALRWSSNRVGALGAGGTINTTALNHGIHTITATVNDSMGATRSVSVTINVVSATATLLRDDFSDTNYTGWSVTNQGTVSAPSVWSASSGSLRQTSDIHSTPITAATVPKPGTFNRWTAGSSWTNYSVTTELLASDNDTLGVMFRYTSTSNYYRFSMDSELPQRRLTKVRNGTWTTLWSDATAYQLNRTYVLEVIANGATITVKLDGAQLWSGTDSNALTTGTVAMYSWRNTGAQFDNVLVRNLSVAFSNANEPRRGIDRLRLGIPLLAKREPSPEPKPPPRAPERIALVTSQASDYRQIGGGVR